MVLMGVMAPLAGVPLQSPVTRQITPGSNWKAMACNRRAMASSMASDGVEPLNGSSSHGHNVPKAKPFNQSRISRLLREPSLLEKADQALAERCTHLEGDEAYRCWEALFEFEDIKEAYQGECDTATGDNRASACRPLERFQNLVRQSGRYLQPLNLVKALPDISETFLIHSFIHSSIHCSLTSAFLFLTSGYFFFECLDRHCSRIFHFSKNRSLTLKQQDQLFF
jgi:hypothetical protein